jgi:hypothetical protein
MPSFSSIHQYRDLIYSLVKLSYCKMTIHLGDGDIAMPEEFLDLIYAHTALHKPRCEFMTQAVKVQLRIDTHLSDVILEFLCN